MSFRVYTETIDTEFTMTRGKGQSPFHNCELRISNCEFERPAKAVKFSYGKCIIVIENLKLKVENEGGFPSENII